MCFLPQGLEEELGNEFDNVSDEDSSQSSEDDAADDGTFGKFLKGIVNPKEEFPEEESMHDVSSIDFLFGAVFYTSQITESLENT